MAFTFGSPSISERAESQREKCARIFTERWRGLACRLRPETDGMMYRMSHLTRHPQLFYIMRPVKNYLDQLATTTKRGKL